MRINTNLGALTAAGNLTKVNDAVRASAEKLSSGFRINKAADDAAGLGVANVFRADIRALTQAQRNAEQASSVYQIAEGGATSIGKLLERMKELAAQSASDSVDSAGRARIQTEYTSLVAEIGRVGNTTEFQGTKLLTGSYGATNTETVGATTVSSVGFSSNVGAVTFAATGTNVYTATNGSIVQTVTANAATAETVNFSAFGISITKGAGVTASADLAGAVVTTAAGSGQFLIGAARNTVGGYSDTTVNLLTISGSALALGNASLGLTTAANIDVTTLVGAQSALSAVDTAMGLVNAALGSIGAGQNRVANAVDNLKSTILNYQAAESTIRDLDMAGEMVTFSKNQILAQAGTAMLAQANQSGQGILKLLQ